MNHQTLFKIGFIVFAFSLFSGLVTVNSPSSFPWKSALAQIDGNETSTGEEPEPPTNGNQTNGNQTNGNVTTPRDELEVRIGDVILQPECAAEHWNKIVFRITTDPTGIVPSNMINTELEVIERVNHIGLLNVKDIVRASIVNEPGVLLPQLTFEEADQLEIEILDVEYGLACLP